MKRFSLKSIGLLALAAIVFQCSGPRERKAASVLDTPEYHYTQGKKFLMNNDLTNAKREFNLAKSLKNDFAPAYEGLAVVALESNQLNEANKMIDAALSRDDDWTPAVIARGRWYMLKGKYDDADDEFEDALDDVDDSPSVKNKKEVKKEALIWRGENYKRWGKFEMAQKTYQSVLRIDNSDTRAARALDELNEFIKAVSGQSQVLKKIALQKEVTRADIAVLFVTELPLNKIFRKAPTKNAIKFNAPGQPVMGAQKAPLVSDLAVADVQDDHWAKSYITQALEKGIMQKFPDGTFKPDQKVNRAELAMLIQNFLVKAYDDPSIETKYFGGTSPFADVLNTSPVFNAIMVVSTRGIMPGMDDGTFKPLSTVSGSEALNIIRTLKAKF